MDDYFSPRYGYEVAPAGNSLEKTGSFPKMPWTIEQQLYAYATNPQRTERHEILWTSWLQDRRWLSQLLEYTVLSTPMYSRHNSSHCEAVIHNIECLLGEDEIRRLSATDCFAILVAVYLHDIGMVTLGSERQNAVKSDGFSRLVQQMKTSNDVNMRWAAETFDELSAHTNEDDPSTASDIYGQRQYDIYRAVVLLLAEFQRRQHADASADRVQQWIRDPAKLQTGLLMTGIPIRIFLQIAACARAHGESDFGTLLTELPKCDDGFTQDKYHPMFIAVLLSLGDILDLDNERFNPFAQDVVGDDLFPATSQIHYRKHQAIRALNISPKCIRIAADCSSTAELRLLCQDMDWLESFLKNCSYHWASIAPDNFYGCLPVVELAWVSLNGARIPPELVTTKFELSQRKAFRLLSGANLYFRRFPFLRELVQNAIDAVKFQYWMDYSSSEFVTKEKVDLCEANRQQPLRKYPIHVDVAVKKRMRNSNGELTDVVADDLKLPSSQLLRDYEFGVEVKVQDCGIGISEEDIKQISKVGTSHEGRQEEISHMPEWLKPTGHFGIGLQSMFLVDDHFTCTTRTRRGECYEMTFHSGDKSEGYINIIPRDPRNGGIPYGTCFSVFVPERYKVSHDKDMTGWLGMDPYQKDYAKHRKLRRSIELMIQLEADLASLIGEPLFPIIPRERELDQSLSDAIALREKLRERTDSPADGHGLVWQTIMADTHHLERSDQDELRCWLFQKQDEKLPVYRFNSLKDGSVYYFDVEHGRLYGWSQHAECFFRCSARRILDPNSEHGDTLKDPQLKDPQLVRLFIKGLFITEISCSQNGLFDYIDIKNDSLQDYLQMNRDGLTAQGVQKLNDEIIPQIQYTFDLILEEINRVNLDIMENNRRHCLSMFDSACRPILNNLSKEDGCFLDVSGFIKTFQKRLENISTTAFSKSSIRVLKKNEKGHGVSLEHEAWTGFWQDVSDRLVKDKDRKEYRKNNYFDTRVGIIGDLRAAFENGVKLEPDLSSELLEQLFFRLNKTVEKARQQENGAPYKASLDQFRKELAEIHQIVFLCALCFFYMADCKANGADTYTKEQESSSWEYLNQGISRLLRYESGIVKQERELSPQFIKLWNRILFFPCIKEDQIGSVHQDTNITDVMLRRQHYAVFSSRSSRKGHWKHMLVHLSACSAAENTLHVPGATVAELLCWRPEKDSQCLRREKLLEEWHGKIIREIVNTYFSWSSTPAASPDSDLWECATTRWMVHNLPSLSLCSDVNGNNRINVLTFRAQPQLFFNTSMINLLMSRMRSTYEEHNAQRMRTTTWDGLAWLNCGDDVTTNILRVDRGKVSEANKQHSMLMAFSSELPSAYIRLPNGKTLEDVSIRTTYDLIEQVKRIYTHVCTEETEDLYGFTYAHDVLACAENIANLLTLNIKGVRESPFPQKTEESDESAEVSSPDKEEIGKRDLVDILQEKFREKQEQEDQQIFTTKLSEETIAYIRDQHLRRENIFLNEDSDRLNDNLKTLYLGEFLDFYERWQKQERESKVQTVWSKVDLPDNPGQYLNSLLVYLYQFDLGETKDWLELEEFSLYETTDELNEEIQKVFWATCYLFQFAGQQYQDEFLENVCHWWMDEVFAKDPGREAFITYSKEHLAAKLQRQELLNLYKEQIRMLLRAQISPLSAPIDKVLDQISVFKAIYQSLGN